MLALFLTGLNVTLLILLYGVVGGLLEGAVMRWGGRLWVLLALRLAWPVAVPILVLGSLLLAVLDLGGGAGRWLARRLMGAPPRTLLPEDYEQQLRAQGRKGHGAPPP